MENTLGIQKKTKINLRSPEPSEGRVRGVVRLADQSLDAKGRPAVVDSESTQN